jgi:non-heme chloroperoxidase
VIAHDRRGHGRSVLDLAMPLHAAVKLLRNSKLVVYEGAPHGLCTTHKDRLDADLLKFLRS